MIFCRVEKTQNTLEDCLTRVPFIIKPPRGVKTEPGVSNALVELVDFSATVHNLTGIEPCYTIIFVDYMKKTNSTTFKRTPENCTMLWMILLMVS